MFILGTAAAFVCLTSLPVSGAAEENEITEEDAEIIAQMDFLENFDIFSDEELDAGDADFWETQATEGDTPQGDAR